MGWTKNKPERGSLDSERPCNRLDGGPGVGLVQVQANCNLINRVVPGLGVSLDDALERVPKPGGLIREKTRLSGWQPSRGCL